MDFEIQDDREGIFPALTNSIAYRENEFPHWDTISGSTSASALLGGISGILAEYPDYRKNVKPSRLSSDELICEIDTGIGDGNNTVQTLDILDRENARKIDVLMPYL